MTDNRLFNLKVMLDPAPSDDVCLAYLDFAKDKILDKMYPFGIPDEVDDVPRKYWTRQCEIATLMYLKRGAEGELTHTENGITRQYANGDVPREYLKDIPSFVRGLGR